MSIRFTFLASIFLLCPFEISGARILSLEMHHRFSETVQDWYKTSSTTAYVWPRKGSYDYYSLLASHDRAALRGRKLQTGLDDALTFLDGNATFRISSLGFLHYTTVTLGTPGVKFLVALDTGSDLFWVPCHCISCASVDESPYTSDFELNIYDPETSSTSKNVTCNSDLCARQNSCSATSGHCPYHVSYVSSETSTSGILVEDVLHLQALYDDDYGDEEPIKAYITFGCGQVQTGSFIDIAAPNGLFGLGFDKISVPSILSREGYVSNSFSMCFGRDGVGRINFGDKGSFEQEETPFNMNSFHTTYDVNVTRVRVGTYTIDSEFVALFDSGTSFTYLIEPLYTKISDSFHSSVQDIRRSHDSRIPFEYCYIMSSRTNTTSIPGLTLTMDGGGQMVIYDPIIVISSLRELVYCLGIIKSPELNIIGQNFMTGYRIVFDRERLVLGWKKFNCYDMREADTHELKPVNYAMDPLLPNHTTDTSTSNGTRLWCRYSKILSHFSLFLLLLLLLHWSSSYSMTE